MKTPKVIAVVLLIILTLAFAAGCTYAQNKSWSDMTEAEKAEARAEFREIRSELEEEFAEDSPGGRLSATVLNWVDAALND